MTRLFLIAAVAALAFAAGAVVTDWTPPALPVAEWTNNGGGGDPPRAQRVGFYEAWEQAKENASFLADQRTVTITCAEYAALTNGMEHIRRDAERRRKARAEARKRASEKAAKEREASRARGMRRVYEIRRAREEAKKGGVK